MFLDPGCKMPFCLTNVWRIRRGRRSKMASIPNAKILELFLCFVTLLFKVYFVISGTIIYFEGNEIPHTVLKGENVSLVCKPRDTSSVNFYTVENFLVESGRPHQGLPNEFNFDCNETNCALKIMMIQRRHAGKYSCSFPLTSVIVDVAYSPRSYPVCRSSHKTDIFFLSSPQEPFNFTCLSEEGYPPINMMLYLLYENEKEKSLMTLSEVEVFREGQSVYLTYFTFLDASFDKVSFRCDVYQQFPQPYSDYSASCESRTLMLPSYAVSIYPPDHTVNANEVSNISLSCISNLTGVKLEWIGHEKLQRNIHEKNATTLQLDISDYVPTGRESLSLQCRGFYGRRTAYASITIDVTFEDQNHNLTALVVVLLLVVLILLITVILLCVRRKMCYTLSQRSAESLRNFRGKPSNQAVPEEAMMA